MVREIRPSRSCKLKVKTLKTLARNAVKDICILLETYDKISEIQAGKKTSIGKSLTVDHLFFDSTASAHRNEAATSLKAGAL